MPISIQEAKTRFQEAGISRSDRFEEGTRGKGAKWEGAKTRAKTNYAPAMAEALAKKAFDKGLDKASGSDYDKGIRDKGVGNWQTGMQTGDDNYAKGVAPFVGLWDADLATAKGPRRSAANIKRMNENVARFIEVAGK